MGRSPPEAVPDARLFRMARKLALFALAIGASALLAALLHVRRGTPWLIDGRPASALCVVLLAFALYSTCRSSSQRTSRGTMASVVAAVLTAEVLAISGLLAPIVHVPIELRPWAGLSAVLLGLAILALHAPVRAISIGLAALPLLLCAGTLVAYLYGARPLDERATPMSALSAVGFTLLSLGTIATRLLPETGELLIGSEPSSRATRRLALGLIVLPVALGALQLLLSRGSPFDPQFDTALLSICATALSLSLCLWYTRAMLLANRRQQELVLDLEHKQALLDAEMRARAERVRGQLLVRQSEEKYRTLAVHAPVGIFESDARGACLFVNRKWTDLTGMSLEQSLGTGWAAAIHPEDIGWVKQRWEDASRASHPVSLEYRMISQSGAVAWVQGCAVPMRDEAGEVTGYLGTVVDVTEQKQAMDALSKSESNFRALVERAPFGVAVSRDGLFVYGNRAYLEMLGYPDASELMGRPLDSVVHPDARDTLAARVRTADFTNLPLITVRCLRKDGTEIVLEGSAATIEFDGQPSQVAVARDVTEQHRAEQVRMLAERALRESLREKEVLLKEIHHRVKNNLQVIVSLINLQAGQLESPEARTALDETRARVHAIALLHERLYRSRNLGRIDMGDYLRGLASDLSSTNLHQRPIELEVRADELFFTMDVAVPIGLIVNELVTNSFKHAFPSPLPRRGHVEVALRHEAHAFVVSVTDDGIGYAPTLDLERMDSLGLLLVSALSRQLGATLSLERPPRGARTVVSIPDAGAASREAG